MLGKLLGAVVSAPVRIVNAPVKMVQKTAEAADKFVNCSGQYSYHAPKRNTLDRISDGIDDACREAFGDD